MKYKIFFAALLFIVSSQSRAENGCPDGMTPFQNGNDPTPKCYPIQGGQNSAPEQPRGRWLNRWGAIAIDNSVNTGGFGAAKNARNKREATKAAIAQCKSSGGGTGCKIKVSYFNQCVVVAWGDSRYGYAWGPDVKETSQDALASCSRATTNCKIYYADCSEAEWVP